jgi:hypothetical protein
MALVQFVNILCLEIPCLFKGLHSFLYSFPWYPLTGIITRTKQKKNRAGLCMLDKVSPQLRELNSKQNKLEAEDTRFKANHKLNNTIDWAWIFFLEGNYKKSKICIWLSPKRRSTWIIFCPFTWWQIFLLLQIPGHPQIDCMATIYTLLFWV